MYHGSAVDNHDPDLMTKEKKLESRLLDQRIKEIEFSADGLTGVGSSQLDPEWLRPCGQGCLSN